MCHCKDLETVFIDQDAIFCHHNIIVMCPLHILAMVYPKNVMSHIQLADVVCN